MIGVRMQTCPSCGATVTMQPYDIGSGPEMSCPQCEWCWGADGQDLKPLVLCKTELEGGRTCALLDDHDGDHIPFPGPEAIAT